MPPSPAPALALLLALSAPPAPAPGSGPSEIRTLNGPQDQAKLGSAVAVVGDLDGDGQPELLAGAPGLRGVGKRSGAALVYSGATGEVVRQHDGDGPWSELGCSVAALGDVDGDGRPDYAVGARFDGADNDRSGSVSVYSGASGNLLRSFSGGAPREAAGTALSALGDLDGDGVTELAVGAPGWSRDGFRVGMVRVYSLAGGALLHEIPGVAADGLAGSVLAAAGDLDGDGAPDLLIGCPGEGEGGAVRVHSGRSGAPLLELAGDEARAEFGAALCSLGDLDGDEIPDFAVGAPGYDGRGEDIGRVSLHSGADGRELAALEGGRSGSRRGGALAVAGDFDGDGKLDLLLGGRRGPEGGSGSVELISGDGLRRIQLVQGQTDGPSFGVALASGPLDAGHRLVAVGAPEANFRGPAAGRVRLYALERGAGQPGAATDAAPTVPGEAVAEAPAAAVGTSFLSAALPARFRRTTADDGRWIFFSTMSTEESRVAVELIERSYGRLDQVLGNRATGAAAATADPVVLAFVSSLEDQLEISGAVGKHKPELQEWVQEWGGMPQMTLWNPLLAIVRHDETTALVKRPELQIVHHLVHLELVRRYGSIPGWVPEALSYGLQDEITGEIYAYSNRGWEQLSEEYHQIWRENSSDLWTGGRPPVLDRLFGGRHDAFKQLQAYGRFGLGLFWLKDPERRLPRLLEGLVALRPDGTVPQIDFQPEDQQQLAALLDCYGRDLQQQVAGFWATVSLAGGPRARRAAAKASVEDAIAALELGVHTSRDGRLRVVSDASKKEASAVLKSASAMTGRLEKALGKGWPEDDPQLTLFLLRDRASYQQVCDGIAAAWPGIGPYLAEARDGVGFLLPHMPVAATWNDIKFQEQTRPAQSVGHQAAHLWLRVRYGQLPLWLSEGLACALEQAEFDSVWANWNLQGFVYDSYRGAWPRTARELLTGKDETVRCYDWTGVPYGAEPPRVERPRPGMDQLYQYRATVFRDELAHLAFAFARYGLEKDKKGLRKLLELLQEEYLANWVTVGRFEPDAPLMRGLVERGFGADFEDRLRAWWAKQ